MSADNPQPRKMTKDLAYIIGIYLGDGSVMSDGRTFCLQTIDKDFAEACSNSIKSLTTNSVRTVNILRLTVTKRQVYAVYVSDIKLCRLLKQQTNNRTNLPVDWLSWSEEERKELISGLLDSEGYVSITRLHEYAGKKVFDMKIGIGACDQWVSELHMYLRSEGLVVGDLYKEIIKSKKIFFKFIFNKKSFIDYGLYFKIGRKQQRIEEYKILFPGSTTTRRIPKTIDTKDKISIFAKSRKRVGGKFVKVVV